MTTREPYGPGEDTRQRAPSGRPTAERAVALATIAYLLAAPGEVLAPLGRLARRRTGAPIGPSLVGLVDAVVVAAVIRARPHAQLSPGVALGGAVWCVSAPLVAAIDGRPVLLPGRSPLWAVALQAVPGLAVASVVVATGLASARRAAPGHAQGYRVPVRVARRP